MRGAYSDIGCLLGQGVSKMTRGANSDKGCVPTVTVGCLGYEQWHRVPMVMMECQQWQRGVYSDSGCLGWQGVPVVSPPSSRIPNEGLPKSPELPVLHSAAMHLVLHTGWPGRLGHNGNPSPPLPSLTPPPPHTHTLQGCWWICLKLEIQQTELGSDSQMLKTKYCTL